MKFINVFTKFEFSCRLPISFLLSLIGDRGVLSLELPLLPQNILSVSPAGLHGDVGEVGDLGDLAPPHRAVNLNKYQILEKLAS